MTKKTWDKLKIIDPKLLVYIKYVDLPYNGEIKTHVRVYPKKAFSSATGEIYGELVPPPIGKGFTLDDAMFDLERQLFYNELGERIDKEKPKQGILERIKEWVIDSFM